MGLHHPAEVRSGALTATAQWWPLPVLLGGVALWAASAPPRSWWWCLPVGSMLVVVAFEALQGRRRIIGCLLAGWLWAATSLWWITEITAVGYLGAVVFLGGLMTLALVVAAGPARSEFVDRSSTRRMALAVRAGAVGLQARRNALLPVTLALLELVLARFPLGGFPLPAPSLGQAAGPFAPAAALGGAPLVTLLATASGVIVMRVLLAGWTRVRLREATAELMPLDGAGRASQPHTSGSVRAAARSWPIAPRGVGLVMAQAGGVLLLSFALLATPVAAGAVVGEEPSGQLRLAVVQGGGPRGLRAVFSDPDEVTQRHLRLAEQLASNIAAGAPGVDLVVLPENILSVQGPVAGSPAAARLARLAETLDAAVVVGVVETASTTFRNAAVLWDADGRLAGRYEKEHRVPFGEYLPWRTVLSGISSAGVLVPRDALVGRGRAVLDVPTQQGTVRLGVVISYEGFFADRVREAVTAGGQAVLVPTNAASYAHDAVPALQVAAAQLRAHESRRSVVQSAPTGFSAFVDAHGRVRAQTALGQAEVLRDTVDLHVGQTPYIRWADRPLLVVCMLVLMAAYVRLPRTPVQRVARSGERPR